MARGRERQVFHPIPSEGKEIGWKHFLEFLPLFMKKRRPAKQELPLIHRLTTKGSPLEPYPPEMEYESMANLLIRDNPLVRTESDLDQVAAATQQYFERAVRHDPEFMRREQTFRITDTRDPWQKAASIRFRAFMPRRGHLRQFGRRAIGGGPMERVAAPHTKPFYTPTESGVKEEYFLGVADRLEPLFEELCDRGDRLFDEAGDDIDKKLEAITYLQLWGASAIHPFFDGNGRAFGGKLVLDLNRAGLPVKKVPGLEEVHPGLKDNVLSGLGPVFLDAFLQEARIPMLSQDELIQVMNQPGIYKGYMATLHDAIEAMMRQETKDTAFAKPYLHAGTHALKLALSRDGFLDRSYYDQNIQHMIDIHARFR